MGARMHMISVGHYKQVENEKVAIFLILWSYLNYLWKQSRFCQLKDTVLKPKYFMPSGSHSTPVHEHTSKHVQAIFVMLPTSPLQKQSGKLFPLGQSL